MIIEISKRFFDLTPDQIASKSQIIENLINSHVSGDHIFAPSRDIAIQIIEFCDLSRRHIEFVSTYIIQRYTMLGSMARSAPRTVLCTFFDEDVEHSNQVAIDIDQFELRDSSYRTRLLVEHFEYDGVFLEAVLEAVARKFGFRNLSYELTHGGGSSVGDMFKRHWSDVRPLVCIVDSDRSFPTDALGGTAKAVKEVGRENRYCTVLSEILPARELENLVPISFLLNVYERDARTQGTVAKYRAAIGKRGRSSEFCPLDYIDLKNGMKKNIIDKIPQPFRRKYVEWAKQCGPDQCRKRKFDELPEDSIVIPAISVNMLIQVSRFIQTKPWERDTLIRKIAKMPRFEELSKTLEGAFALAVSSGRLPIEI